MNSEDNKMRPYIDIISLRHLDENGFAAIENGQYRVEATAWAVLALITVDDYPHLIESGRKRLVTNQSDNGSICVNPNNSDVWWPTPLAIIAWQGALKYAIHQFRAIQFLLDTSGKHFRKKSESPVGHDTAIKGWPWTAETHSWVEPTALSLMALQVSGHGQHKRAREATDLLLNRQLPSGGWNYGNTTVFGKELRPMPEYTGVALQALAGRVGRPIIAKSLDYLKNQFKILSTPFALGWAVLALKAWGENDEIYHEKIIKCFNRQSRYGAYNTMQLSLLIIADWITTGLMDLFEKG